MRIQFFQILKIFLKQNVATAPIFIYFLKSCNELGESSHYAIWRRRNLQQQSFCILQEFSQLFSLNRFQNSKFKILHLSFHPKLKDLFLLRGNFAKLKFSSGEEPAQYVGFELFYFFFYFVTIFTLAAFNLVYYSRVTRLFFVEKKQAKCH